MTDESGCRRVLIAAGEAAQAPLGELFVRGLVPGWQPMTAESFERARFLLQHDPCDVLLVDESLYVRESPQGLAWLADQAEAPVVLLSAPAADLVAAALHSGVIQWLPRQLILEHPPLLAAALLQASRWSELRRRVRLAADGLQECRRQVSRLVAMLWESTPLEANTRWFTQRYMMDRLQEEIARSARHGSPFSVVLGEVRVRSDSPLQTVGWGHLSAPAAERIGRAKRRCDVIGRYGPDGFMLLLANTPEQGAIAFCRRLEEQLAQEPALAAFVTSFGVAASGADTPTSQSLLGRAEERLERARLGQESDNPRCGRR
jgi:diguanylate cyclase (GGDEF)-like protein